MIYNKEPIEYSVSWFIRLLKLDIVGPLSARPPIRLMTAFLTCPPFCGLSVRLTSVILSHNCVYDMSSIYWSIHRIELKLVINFNVNYNCKCVQSFYSSSLAENNPSKKKKSRTNNWKIAASKKFFLQILQEWSKWSRLMN